MGGRRADVDVDDYDDADERDRGTIYLFTQSFYHRYCYPTGKKTYYF